MLGRTPQPATLYRHLLIDAWKRMCERKTLWVFGLFAAAISTGGVADTLIRALKQTDVAGKTLIHAAYGSFAGFQEFGFYIRQLLLLPQERIDITIFILLALFVIFVVIVICSQGLLVQGLLEKKPISLGKLWKKSAGKFFNILMLALFSKIALGVVVILSAMLLSFVINGNPNHDDLIYFATFMIWIPIVVCISVVSTLSLIDIVKNGSHALDAIHKSMVFFGRHLLITLELGLLLFFVTFFALAILLLGISLLGALYIIVQVALVTYGFATLSTILFFLSIIFLTLVAVGFVALTCVFQHACWVMFFERAAHPTLSKNIRAKFVRIFSR